MAPGSRRRVRGGLDYWPGFVDALSTMLLTFVFLVSVFMMAQYFLSRDVTGKDAALQKLTRQIEELTQLLALEKSLGAQSQGNIATLQATLDATKRDRDAAQAKLAAGAGGAGQAEEALTAEKKLSAEAQARVDLLNQQIAALRRQLAAIEQALQASEAQNKDSQAKIADLGARLNVALAQKVQELARYRSDFFGRLRDVVGARQGVRIAGDRFVFPSDVLFASGQATLSTEAPAELDRIVGVLKDMEREIPPDINWVMRVDGHTDARPIASAQFPSNWSLSAARAIAVVQYFISKGVAPQHLVAAGFGEFQPVETGDSEEALRRNRRIELKLTDR
jgi:chemotaxis protein MotB